MILQYGHAVFDGCGADTARPSRVGRYPALLMTIQAGSPYASIIWPATPKHPEGWYGITGGFTGPEIRRLAASMARTRQEARPSRRNAGC